MSQLRADVAIVRAGTATHAMSRELRARGLQVIVLNDTHCSLTGMMEYGSGVRLDWIDRGKERSARVRYVVACHSSWEQLGALMGVARLTHRSGRFRIGRCFLVGACAAIDSAIADAANLAWKLAAVIQGWGGVALLDTYDNERRPLVQRMASCAGAVSDRQTDSAHGDWGTAPEASGHGTRSARVRAHHRTNYLDELQASLRYESCITATDDSVRPATGAPGKRAPRVVLERGELADHFGPDFTLLWLGIKSPDDNWGHVAATLGIPLSIVPCGHREALSLYGADLVLIRPDGHITWRGDTVANAAAVLRLATLN